MKKIKKLKFLALVYSLCTSKYTKYSPKKIIQIIRNIFHFILKHHKNSQSNPFYKIFVKQCKKYNYLQNTEFVSTLSFKAEEKKHIKKRSNFDEIIYKQFEMLQIPVPKEYEDALTRRYGNWNEWKIGASDHGSVLFDTEHPYTKYIKD